MAFYSFICLPEREVDAAFTASLFVIYFHHLVLRLSCSLSILIYFFFSLCYWKKKMATWVFKYRPRLVNMWKYMGINPYGTDAYCIICFGKDFNGMNMIWGTMQYLFGFLILLYCSLSKNVL